MAFALCGVTVSKSADRTFMYRRVSGDRPYLPLRGWRSCQSMHVVQHGALRQLAGAGSVPVVGEMTERLSSSLVQSIMARWPG